MHVQNKGKKTIAVVLAVGVLSMTAYAAPPFQVEKAPPAALMMVMPRWTHILDLSAGLSNDGKTLRPKVYVMAVSETSKITGTMYLERKSGSSWVQASSWNISGTGSASQTKSYNGTAGTEYRTRIVVTVNGEKAEAVSDSCTV